MKNIVFSEKRYFLLKYIPTDAILYIEVMLMDKINFISSCCLDKLLVIIIVISNIIFLLLGYIMGRPERVEKIKESLKKDNNEVYEAYEPIE